MTPIRSTMFVVFAMLILLPPATAAETVGVTAVITNRVTGGLGTARRTLGVGDRLVQNENIDTARKSAAQLLFNDETSLTMGPDSSVVLDRFVYDPKRNVGSMVINATKGAFRFITGSADPRSYKIVTPVAQLGVRGTIIDFLFDAQGRLTVILVEGAVLVCPTPQSCVTINTPGDFVRVGRDGRMNAPARWTGGIRKIGMSMSFPLFGHKRLGDWQQRFRLPYGSRGINDALDGTMPILIPGHPYFGGNHGNTLCQGPYC